MGASRGPEMRGSEPNALPPYTGVGDTKMGIVAGLATDTNKTAHMDVTQVLATCQVKDNDKLPLKEIVKRQTTAKLLKWTVYPSMTDEYPLRLYV